jgi:hypothetical protein
LIYYVEIRQKPGSTDQIFDDQIPIDGAPQQGGVVVTKVFTDKVNNNQQMRFITLLHEPHVLKKGGVATDPARGLKITVLDDNVVSRPLVCKVKVEWSKEMPDFPGGDFDLRIDPWDANFQIPDIWVDRAPFDDGKWDTGAPDKEGRPLGNGDKPRPMEINHLWGRIHYDEGKGDSGEVLATFYSVTPPGVGDNGNWAPIKTEPIPKIAKDSYFDVPINWTPLVGEHTCLKLYAEHQEREKIGGNNFSQENVFDFEAPAHSIPEPVVMSVAVRNPLSERTVVLMSITGVPEGYMVHFPHSWLWLDPLGERRFNLTIIPTKDYEWYQQRKVSYANVRLGGQIPHQYWKEMSPSVFPSSRMLPIGGITARVTPKKGVKMHLQEDGQKSAKNTISVTGRLEPSMSNETIRIDAQDPENQLRMLQTQTDAQGQFYGLFDLSIKHTLDAKPKEESEETLSESIKYKHLSLILHMLRILSQISYT